MTTIACNRKCMAADSLTLFRGESVGGLKTREETKIYAVPTHMEELHLIGGSGDSYGIERFVRWYRRLVSDPAFATSFWDKFDDVWEGRPKLIENGGMSALILTPQGILWFDKELMPFHLYEPFWAIGSGCEVALGAMHAGATPTEAVEIACKVDSASGLPVLTQWLER